jgi:hypothetical protein
VYLKKTAKGGKKMTSLREAWKSPYVMPRPEPPPQNPTPPPNQHNLAHNPPLAYISRTYDEAIQHQGPSRLELLIQDSMANIHRDVAGLKDEVRMRDDKQEKFDKLERLIKRATLAILATLLVLIAFTWIRAERYAKHVSGHIAKLAGSRITVDQLLNLVSQV